MKLSKVIIENFRSYSHRVELSIEQITAIIGKNDVGKSSILDALDTFFNQGKLDVADRNIHSTDNPVIIGRVFSNPPILRWSCGTAAHQCRLRELRFADRHGQRKPAEYVPHLRRQSGRQAAPPDGLYRPSLRCSRPVVHRRFRGNLAGCAGGMPEAAERINYEEVRRKWISWSFVEQKSMCSGISSEMISSV